MEKRQPLQQMFLGKVVICLQKKLKLDPCLSPCTKKWIKDLNIRPETLKLVQERAGNTLGAIGICSIEPRERMDKWDTIKLKSFCTTKEMVSKLKRPPTEWEKTFANYTSDKGLITKNGAQKTKLSQNQ
jgi:hypothetical protein